MVHNDPEKARYLASELPCYEYILKMLYDYYDPVVR